MGSCSPARTAAGWTVPGPNGTSDRRHVGSGRRVTGGFPAATGQATERAHPRTQDQGGNRRYQSEQQVGDDSGPECGEDGDDHHQDVNSPDDSAGDDTGGDTGLYRMRTVSRQRSSQEEEQKQHQDDDALD